MQVAASFINELGAMSGKELPQWFAMTDIFVSHEVLANVTRRPVAATITEVNTRPGAWRRNFPRKSARWDVAFTVFGPAMRRRVAAHEIVGFAAPRVLASLPDEGLPLEGPLEPVVNKVKRQWIRRDDLLVVESRFLQELLEDRRIRTPCVVVSNAVSEVFLEPGANKCDPLDLLVDGDPLLLAVVGRDYPHKNLSVLPAVGSELESRLDRPVRFVTTLTAEEAGRRTQGFRNSIVNVGPQPVSSLPSLYRACHGTFFPTLLESFSVTPLESMAMNRPVFASDRKFIRDVYTDAVGYFDPLDVGSMADTLSSAFLKPQDLETLTDRGRRLLAEMPSARDRANRYLDLISSEGSRGWS